MFLPMQEKRSGMLMQRPLLSAAQRCDLCWVLTPASSYETASVSPRASALSKHECVARGDGAVSFNSEDLSQ